LSPDWVDLFQRLSGRRAHIGLSRLARYASAQGIVPEKIDDEVIAAFINQQQERCFALGHNSAPSQGRFRGA
jgi:hypothetical protein